MPTTKGAPLTFAQRPAGAYSDQDSFVLVDPGGTTGWAYVTPSFGDAHHYVVDSRPLAELPSMLHSITPAEVAFVVVESYHLAGGTLGRQQAGSDMPASMGIGMVWLACQWKGVPCYRLPPNAKPGGHRALDEAGKMAYAAATNDHKRDVVDLAGYVLRELRA